jgi:hypothetical protein
VVFTTEKENKWKWLRNMDMWHAKQQWMIWNKDQWKHPQSDIKKVRERKLVVGFLQLTPWLVQEILHQGFVQCIANTSQTWDPILTIKPSQFLPVHNNGNRQEQKFSVKKIEVIFVYNHNKICHEKDRVRNTIVWHTYPNQGS